jgi:tripartite-type tricarboxylate transporter receptor subunit TctC
LVSKVQYDLSKITWLGRISVDNEIGLVAAKSPIKTIADVKGQAKTYTLSTQGLSATGTIAAAILFEALGTKWKPLNHDQLGPAALAVIRGDADMYFGTYESTLSYLDAKELRPIVYYDTKRHPQFPDVPTPADVGLPQLGEMIPQRIIGGPPGIPANVAKILEEAAWKTVNEDKEFATQVKKMKKTVNYASAAETAKIVETTLSNYTKYESTVKNLLVAK